MIKEKQTIESFRSFSWVTSKIRGSFVSELLRASWHSGGSGECAKRIYQPLLKTGVIRNRVIRSRKPRVNKGLHVVLSMIS